MATKDDATFLHLTKLTQIKITRRAEQTALIGAEQIPAKRATKSDGVLCCFSANDYIVLVMKLIDDWNGIITIQAVKNITKAGEVVPQLFLFLKFLLHDG